MFPFDIPVPGVKLALDGRNYGYWSTRMRIYFEAVGVWDHITGASPCPPAPAPPPPGAVSQDAASKSYQQALDAYNGWRTDDARVKLVLFDGVEALIDDKPTAQQMWADLKGRYERIVDAVHYSLLQQLQNLQQGSDSVDAFFGRFISVWNKLHCLIPSPEVCQKCACCVKRREFEDKSCLYDFLIRLRPEFDRARDLLLFSSPVPTMIDALKALRVEEMRLQNPDRV
jgi:hypothetical protein